VEIKKLLWATDFSENAGLALPYVNSLSEKYGSEVHVIYVLEAWGDFGAWYGDYDQDEIEKIQVWAREKAEARLSRVCEEHLKGCRLYIRHIAVGDPAEEILKTAGQEKVDLLVLTTHGEKGRFHFGSVADQVVKHSSVPVITIPIKK